MLILGALSKANKVSNAIHELKILRVILGLHHHALVVCLSSLLEQVIKLFDQHILFLLEVSLVGRLRSISPRYKARDRKGKQATTKEEDQEELTPEGASPDGI